MLVLFYCVSEHCALTYRRRQMREVEHGRRLWKLYLLLILN